MRHHIDSMSLGFRCNKCNFTVSTKQSITAHEIAHHSGIPLVGNIAIKSEAIPTKEEPNVAIEQESLKQENEENDNGNNDNDATAADVDDKQSDEGNDFDANAFLEVVLHDDSQPQPDSSAIEKLENSSSIEPASEWRNLHKTKIFYCINCCFR